MLPNDRCDRHMWFFKKKDKNRVEQIDREDWSYDILPTTELISVQVRGYTPYTFCVSDVHFASDVYDVIRATVKLNMLSRPAQFAKTKNVLKHVPFSLFYKEKLVRDCEIPLLEFNVSHMSMLTVVFHLSLGGSREEILLPTYRHVLECEQELLNEFEPQSTMISRFFGSEEYISNYSLKLIEDVALLAYHVMAAKTKVDYGVAALNFAKLRSSGPILRNSLLNEVIAQVEQVFGFEQQSEPSMMENGLSNTREFLDNYDSFKKGPLVKKLYRLTMYCLANELFSGVGLTMTKLNYSQISQEAMRKEFYLGPSFVQCLLDTLLFLCEQGHQCIKLGSLAPIVHGPKTYQKWFDLCMDLKIKVKCLCNPEEHGFTKFDFLRDLDTAIDQGSAIRSFAGISTPERKLVSHMLSDMKMLKADCVTKGAAQKTRKAPMATLIYAGSSVGKSTFVDILFTYHGKIAKLPTESSYRYNVTFNDEYESGFTTSQWSWYMDDIAFQHPNAAQGIDPSLLSVIQSINNAPFVTNQADLPDKGRIPMWCEQVLASTNVMDLNATAYFSNPLAIQRRFPYVVELAPKPEFARESCMLDGHKVNMVGEHEYPNWWKIKVWKVIPKAGMSVSHQRADYVTELETLEISEFLMWYRRAWVAHEAMQKKVIEGNAQFADIHLCECHYLPLRNCPDATVLVQQALAQERCIDCEVEFDPTCGCRMARDIASCEWCIESPNPFCECTSDSNPATSDSASSVSSGYTIHKSVSEVGETLHFVSEPPSPPHSYVYGANEFIDDESIASTRNVWTGEQRYGLDDMVEVGVEMTTNKAELAAAWNLGFPQYFFAWAIQWGVYFFLEYAIFRDTVGWFYTFPVLRRAMWKFFFSSTRDSRVFMHVFSFMGKQAQRKVGCVPYLVTLASFLTAGIATYKFSTWLFGRSPSQPSYRAESREGTKPVPRDERGENVWYNAALPLTPFDLPLASKSIKGKMEMLVSLAERNTVKLISQLPGSYQAQTLVCLGGQLYVANNHGIPTHESFKATLIQGPLGSGVNQNVSLTLTQTQIIRYPEHDLCFLELSNIPPRSGVSKYIPDVHVEGEFKGKLVLRREDGSIDHITVDRGFSSREFEPYYQQEMRMWSCFVSRPTVNGDCGSPLIMDTPMGPMVLGIHALGDRASRSKCASLTMSIVRQVQARLRPQVVPQPPNLNAQSAKSVITDLSDRSVFRFLEEGTCEIFGSFGGWKATLKSRVTRSLIADSVSSVFNVAINHGAPQMKGWKPWRIAAQDMVEPTMQIRDDKLKMCVEAFKQDIDRLLPKSELELIHVLDLNTTVNGANGVKYIDKMPRDTSMGFPWRTNKKGFLRPNISADYPEGVMYTPEVLDRVNFIIDSYHAGKRYMAVFVAHLKDEATKWSKVLLGKTRVFTGAPVDWSIVVRMYFLSCVRVIQRNKFVFEAGPGTNPQSVEWENIGKYLTQHGADRMVAGDYAAFDKSMPPNMILAAFDILIHMCEQAGYSKDAIKVCWGVAYDTAFPIVDFNGDLVQFYGSNPSGHPLTVIVNSLANSLYMRYCYQELSPQRSCVDFKQHVSLMTYGDDNVMGVSRRSPWFHHTAIQHVLSGVGIKYTMADKEAESVPYIPFGEVSFLKRTWEFDIDVGHYLAPLEEASIFKMLTVNVESRSECAEAHARSIMTSAMNEWFFYGRDVYERRALQLQQVVEQCGLQMWTDGVFLPYDTLVARFHKNSLNVVKWETEDGLLATTA